MSAPLLPALHLDVLYETDDRGRIAAVRGGNAATPLAHFFRTATGNRWLIGTVLPEGTAARLDTAFADEPVLEPGDWEHSAPRCLEVVRNLLVPFRQVDHASPEYRGPAYAFPDDLPIIGSAEEYAPDSDVSRVASDLEWIATASEVERPIVVVRDEDGRVVSVCHAARATSEGAEAGLDTQPRSGPRAASRCTAHRGRTRRRAASLVGWDSSCMARTGTSASRAGGLQPRARANIEARGGGD